MKPPPERVWLFVCPECADHQRDAGLCEQGCNVETDVIAYKIIPLYLKLWEKARLEEAEEAA